VQIKGGWFLRILGRVIAWNSTVISPRTRPERCASLCRAAFQIASSDTIYGDLANRAGTANRSL